MQFCSSVNSVWVSVGHEEWVDDIVGAGLRHDLAEGGGQGAGLILKLLLLRRVQLGRHILRSLSFTAAEV